jgi:protein TonB
LTVHVFSFDEIATAAGVSVGHVESRVVAGEVPAADRFVGESDAIRLVREIVGGQPPPTGSPSFFSVVKSPPERPLTGLFASAGLHVLAVTLLVAASLSLLDASNAHPDEPATPVKLVYFIAPGPGGGGGGGGLKIPPPTRRAARQAPAPRKISSPVPEVRPPAPPPEPKPEPKPEPPKPAPPAVVTAPVVPKPADPVEATGVPSSTPTPAAANQGSGSGGGAGTGAGRGVGEGTGAGIGPGTDAGEGGGPFRPGSGISPPKLLREVKADYSEDARRAGIEGEVVLEIVVRRDGSVGDVRVKRGVDRGLDQRAIAAVRQWRFTPATRRGAPVEVIVEVGVDFRLR